MPVRIAVLGRGEVFECPAAELEFVDEIDFGESESDHVNRVWEGKRKNPSVN